MRIYQCIRSGKDSYMECMFFIAQHKINYGSVLCPRRREVDTNYFICTKDDNPIYYDKLIYEK